MKKKEIKIPGLIVPKIRKGLYTKYGNGLSEVAQVMSTFKSEDFIVDYTRWYDAGEPLEKPTDDSRVCEHEAMVKNSENGLFQKYCKKCGKPI